MTTKNYRYNYAASTAKALPINSLSPEDNAGHSDHWALLGADSNTLQSWLAKSLEGATAPLGLGDNKTCDEYLLIASNDSCHIKQIFALQDGKPSQLLNVFPAVNSPYGLVCQIEQATVCPNTQDAVLTLKTEDGTSIYAFDQLYAINGCHYKPATSYYVNFSAWAYNLAPSAQDEIILVEDPEAIRYHRAFNDIIAKNNGKTPADLQAQIKAWQSADDVPLAPVEINLGQSCIYLFGETCAQEDEAWCQGQVLGKSTTQFFGQEIILFDVVILREAESAPFVVRIASLANAVTSAIAVQDYVQANIWLQAAIYPQTQKSTIK